MFWLQRCRSGVKHWEVGFYAHMILWVIMLLTMASGSWLLFEEPILRVKRFLPYTEDQSPLPEVRYSGLIGVSR